MTLLPMAAVVSALALGGCPSVSSPFEGRVAQSAAVDAEKALAVAHLAYDAIGVSLEQAALSGALSGEDAAKAQTLFDEAGAALDVADRADAAANAPGVLAAVADAQALVAQIHAIINK